MNQIPDSDPLPLLKSWTKFLKWTRKAFTNLFMNANKKLQNFLKIKKHIFTDKSDKSIIISSTTFPDQLITEAGNYFKTSNKYLLVVTSQTKKYSRIQNHWCQLKTNWYINNYIMKFIIISCLLWMMIMMMSTLNIKMQSYHL